MQKKIIKELVMLIICLSITSLANAKSSLEKFGDAAQIINPIFTAAVSSREKGVGHFGLIYAQSMGIMAASKHLGMQSKWKISKRPKGASSISSKTLYNGFPSGHTTSAWSSASYARVFFDENKYVAIPLYISAAVTAYSRYEAKKHTQAQIFGAIILSEAVTEINKRLKWSNDYRYIDFSADGNGLLAKIGFRF